MQETFEPRQRQHFPACDVHVLRRIDRPTNAKRVEQGAVGVRPGQQSGGPEQAMVVQARKCGVCLPVDRRKAGARKDSYRGDRGVGAFYPAAQRGSTFRRRGIIHLAEIDFASAADRIGGTPKRRWLLNGRG